MPTPLFAPAFSFLAAIRAQIGFHTVHGRQGRDAESTGGRGGGPRRPPRGGRGLLPLMRAYCDFYEASPRPGPARDGSNPDRGSEAGGDVHRSMDGGGRLRHPRLEVVEPKGARIGYLEDLYVTPETRGRGIADALIEARAERCRERGAPAMEWLTAPRQPSRPSGLRPHRRRRGDLRRVRTRAVIRRSRPTPGRRLNHVRTAAASRSSCSIRSAARWSSGRRCSSGWRPIARSLRWTCPVSANRRHCRMGSNRARRTWRRRCSHSTSHSARSPPRRRDLPWRLGGDRVRAPEPGQLSGRGLHGGVLEARTGEQQQPAEPRSPGRTGPAARARSDDADGGGAPPSVWPLRPSPGTAQPGRGAEHGSCLCHRPCLFAGERPDAGRPGRSAGR